YDIQNKTTKQITTDGEKNKIINGTTDWVYEEEFAFVKGAYWSPDGNYIAYYKFDESNVKEYTISFYGNLYPDLYTYKYPKAGEENSKVAIYIYKVKEDTHIKINLPQYEYVPRIKWTNTSQWLSVQTMNRHQNELTIWKYNPQTSELKPLYQEKNKYYVDVTDNLTFIDNNKYFLITAETSGFNHIYMYDFETGKQIRQITSGNWDVVDFYGYDSKRKTLYYSSHESSPINTEVYSINISGKGKKKLTPQENGTAYANFSKTFDYYIHYHSDAATPTTVTLHKSNGKLIRTLEDNSELKELLKEYQISPMEFFKIPVSDNIELNAWMIKPHNFDENKQYPVLMYVYGGPGSQTVTNSWQGSNFFWYQILANKGYIIVSVDNRGTGGRGEEFKKSTYKQLGKYESQDQINAAKYLGDMPYIDKSRIGIWGWSFGGYLSSLCLFKGNDVFKMAIAVAPVTNWRYYDTIYTERYMQTPQENPDGYDNNSPINHVDKLKGNYLLVHGLADDNVHFQNAADLITALVNADKQFEMLLYPNKNHGIYGGNTRYHLYTKLTDFIEKNL
ncbi:MAG: S9 family peptidase, partial [Bacteroidetes bacterium]